MCARRSTRARVCLTGLEPQPSRLKIDPTHTCKLRVGQARPTRASTSTVYALAVRRFRRLCLAFTVLKDDERRRIYMAAGYAGLRNSEAYQESWLGLGLERTLTLTLTLTSVLP